VDYSHSPVYHAASKGFFMLGGILDAFMPGKTKTRYFSDDLNRQAQGAIQSMPQYREAQAQDLSRYTGALNRAVPQVENLAAGDTGLLGQLIGQRTGSAMDTYQGVGNTQMGLLQQIIGSIANQGTGALNQQMARMGYGGRGGSSFQTNQLLDRISANIAPVASQMMGNIGRDASAIEMANTGRLGEIMGMMNARSNIPLRTADLMLAPAEARNRMLMNEIMALGGFGDVTRGNVAGFEYQQNPWAAAATSVDNQINRSMDRAAGMIGGVGGGGGGGGGGLLGGLLGMVGFCHVARLCIPDKWPLFYWWKELQAPEWFRDAYNKNSERWAAWLEKHPVARKAVTVVMRAIVNRLERSLEG
jgi:hypothetical protein